MAFHRIITIRKQERTLPNQRLECILWIKHKNYWIEQELRDDKNERPTFANNSKRDFIFKKHQNASIQKER